MKKPKSKPKKKKKEVRKTKKKKSICKAQSKPILDAIEENDDIAEAKIEKSIGIEDEFLDRYQIDSGDEDDEDDEGNAELLNWDSNRGW